MILNIWLRNWDLHKDSPNLRRGRHWSVSGARSRLAKQYVLAALCELRRSRGDSGREVNITGPVEISVVYRMKKRQRPLDKDNAVGALKPVIDALVHHKVLEGDGIDIIPHEPHVLEIDAAKHGGYPGLDITIRPLPKR